MANSTRSPSRAPGTRSAGARPGRPRSTAARRSPRLRLPGGTEGNERLTILAGILLIVVFAGVGITILRIGQLLWLHLFLGLAVAGPVALKLASTGYRFTMYYLGERRYQRKGPPPPMLRMLAPVLVVSTIGVLLTGVALLIVGRHVNSPALLLHKGFFIVWIAVCGVHVLVHLPELAHAGSPARRTRSEILAGEGGSRAGAHAESVAARRAQAFALVISVLAGLALATALTGTFHSWTG
jgi:hypothetical protein